MLWPFYLLIFMAILFGFSAFYRSPRVGKSTAQMAIDVYKDQLLEVEQMVASGQLSTEDAQVSLLEIKRRILREDQKNNAAESNQKYDGGLIFGIAFIILLALGAYSYSLVSTPKYWADWAGLDHTDDALADADADMQMADARAAYDRLSDFIKKNADDQEALALYVDMSLQLGEFINAANGLGALAVLDPTKIDFPLQQGEVLMRVTNGVFTPAVLNSFAEAAAINPRHPAPRFYFGAWSFENQNYARALEIWQALLEESLDDAPWRPMLEARVAEAQSLLNDNSESGMDRLPSDDAIAAFEAMTEDERAAFVESMVDRLRDRLQEDPSNFDNWVRLARAEEMLGNIDAAITALGRAKELATDDQKQAIEEEIQALKPA